MSDFFHECEANYPLRSADDREKLEQRIVGCGFVCKGDQFESDVVPDTADFRCRQQKLVLRFRHITRKDNTDVLVTLKVRGEAAHFQEHFELEYYLSKPNAAIFADIRTTFRDRISVDLPETLNNFKPDQFDMLIADVKKILPSHRIVFEKVRRTYTRGDCKALIDTLPEGLGDYLELEAPSPDQLQALIIELGLADTARDPRDYGQLLTEHKAQYPEQEKRTGRFTATERRTLLEHIVG